MEEDSELSIDDFYFESDHLSLRENEDYKNVLKTIALLESQRMNVCEELEDLMAKQAQYLENPQLLIHKLKTGQPITKSTKPLLSIPNLPDIIGKYENLKTPNYDIKKIQKSHPTVRGRPVDETKPETFNQLWTCEEQRRLEELLMKYPPEQKERRRYLKIAQELGNRTPQQVSSRIQKYFLKLHDAGMPIPGRVPKARRLAKNSKLKNTYKPSTFFPSHNVPVNMPSQDDDDDNSFYMHTIKQESMSPLIKTEHSTDDDDDDDGGDGDGDDDDDDDNENLDNGDARPMSTAPSASSASDVLAVEASRQNDLKIQMLKAIRKEKFVTTGYQPDPMALSCEECQSAAVSRTTWRCNTCYINLNLCCDCLAHQLVSDRFEHIGHEVVGSANSTEPCTSQGQ